MKQRKFGRRTHRDPFTLVPLKLMASPEWRALQPAARVIFIDIARRHRHEGSHGPDNNGRIGFGCTAGARAANVSVATAYRRMLDLHKSGLAKNRNPGVFRVKAGDGRASEWELAIFPIAGRQTKYWGEGRLRLDHWLLDSTAYRNLTNPTKCILLELMRRYDGGNNGRISFGGADGASAGLSTDVTERALTELVRAGFLVQTATAVPHLRHPRKWRLTMYAADGRAATKDFMRMMAEVPPKKKRSTVSPVRVPRQKTSQ